ncbi:MAG TPA: hypothetical protein VMM60_06480 [Ilumatobacter sp.]|nr:hypothetical protein [Ilumatobacter sp.]
MSEQDWQQARLIPTSGINGQEEAERRATSALLAVMSAVREFGVALTKPYGAPATWLETFIEVPFKSADGKKLYPDGLIRARRGAKSWTALVEVKTGDGVQRTDQVEAYLDVAKAEGFDAVLTISNEIAYAPSVHPVTVDKRKVKSVALHHLSWSEVLSEAIKQRVYRGVADPDQAWILSEFIRYMEHPKSGATDFDDMGDHWVAIRNAAANGTLRANNEGLVDVVQRWEKLGRFCAMELGRELGADVLLGLSRAEVADPQLRIDMQKKMLIDHGTLSFVLRIPDAISDVTVGVDLRSNRVSAHVDLDAPAEGRQATRVNWLLRQLSDAPPQLCIDAWTQGARQSLSELLKDARETPDKLVADSKKDIKRFRLTATTQLGSGRKIGKNSFIGSVLDVVNNFYGEVVQGLTAWTPKAPKLPTGGRSSTESAGIDTRPPPSEVDDGRLPSQQQGRQGLLAPPSGPPERPQWLDIRPVAVDGSD